MHIPLLTQSLTQTLRKARRSAGLTQSELSKRAGISQSHISKIEQNAMDITLSTLIHYTRALDLEVCLIPRGMLPVIESTLGLSQADHQSPFLSEPKYTLEDDEQDD